MLPAPPNFHHNAQLPHFSLQSYGPHIPPGYLSHTNLQDPLHPGADPNSPEVFKNNIRTAHQQVLELQTFAKKVLSSIQNAYQTGNSPAHTEADISSLKQMLAIVIEKLRQSGVGALPVIPPPPTTSPSGSSAMMVDIPNEKTLLDNVQVHIRANHDKLQRSQDSAAVVANLLTTDFGANANARMGAR